MGYSYGYCFKTKKRAMEVIGEIEYAYMKSHGKKPEVYIEKMGRNWVVRDFGVRIEPKNKLRFTIPVIPWLEDKWKCVKSMLV